MSAERRWSKARKLALEAFFLNDGRARRSNSTNATCPGSEPPSSAYWQSVDWLLSEQLVEPVPGVFDMFRLTVDGWEAGRQLWNVPQRTLERMMAKAAAS